MTKRLLPLALALTMPFAASAKVLWRGDFETGDISQWTKAQQVSPDRLKVQEDRVREGKYALRALVKHGDDPINASGHRNELVDVNYQPEGAERWYRWYTYFDESYPSERKWQVFTQWHQYEDYGSPPIEFDVYGEEIHLTNWTNVIWKAPLQRGRWLEFIFHVKWSKDPNVGFVELWYDGQKVLEKKFLKTDSKVYLKQGLYWHADIKVDGIVYHDGMIMGETWDDVKPAETDDGDTGGDTGGGDTGGGDTGGGDTGGGDTGGDTGGGSDGGTEGDGSGDEGTGDGMGYPSPTPDPNDLQAAGCSTSGATALPLAALALAAFALLRRRQPATVRVRSRR